jgi:hypothetical protein
MTQITAPCPTTALDAIVDKSKQAPAHQRTGPLRSGNPRGNPNLAPRCGAKARTTGHACRAPAMANGRCRLHGGTSTGWRTPEGLARLAAARTTHGDYAQAGHGAELRAMTRHANVANRRARLTIAAHKYLPWLPAAFAARLRADEARELDATVHHSNFACAPAADSAPGSVAPPGQARSQALGSGLNHVHQMRLAARRTAARKFLASLS